MAGTEYQSFYCSCNSWPLLVPPRQALVLTTTKRGHLFSTNTRPLRLIVNVSKITFIAREGGGGGGRGWASTRRFNDPIPYVWRLLSVMTAELARSFLLLHSAGKGLLAMAGFAV